jgi:hypothetical protein
VGIANEEEDEDSAFEFGDIVFFNLYRRSKVYDVLRLGVVYGKGGHSSLQLGYEHLPDGPWKRISIQRSQVIKRFTGELRTSIAERCSIAGLACMHCGTQTTQVQLMKCSGCLRARYCSEDCQKQDFESHKRVCNLPPTAPPTLSSIAHSAWLIALARRLGVGGELQ